MKVNELLTEKDKKDKDSWFKRADAWMKDPKRFVNRAIDTLQTTTGKPGPNVTKLDDPKIKKTKKKVKPQSSKKPMAKNDKIDIKKIPAGATYTDDKGVVYVYNDEKDIWFPNDGGMGLTGRTGAVAYNRAPRDKRMFTEQVLKEGGNIWPDETEDFDQAIIPDMMKQVNSVLAKTGAKALPIGSGATPTPGKRSGDLDMIIDAGKLGGHFKVSDAKAARVELEKLFQQAGFDTKKSGTSVHVKTKVGGAAQQVDIMVVDNGETAQKFHVHDIPKGSPYKGIHKQIMIADLAKEKDMKWSPYKGLVNRETNELVSNNMDEIAKQLLGPNATAKDLGSVESIIKANPEAQAIVDKYEGPESPNPVWQQKKVQPKENNEIVNAFRRIQEV